MRLRSWLLLPLLFLCSVAVRAPLLGRPLAWHHEWVTAHMLIVMQIWWRYGIGHFHYCPVITWQNPGDQGIGWEKFLLLHDAHGNFYHASYPPLGYWLPYGIFAALGILPDVLGLEIINLALCALGGFLLFATVRRLYRGEPAAEAAAGWATILYFFLPGTLWFHANTYFVDMLMQPLFLGFLLALLCLLEEPKRRRWWIVTGALLMLLALTEWIALFCAVAAGALVAWRLGFRANRWRITALLGLTAASLLLTPLLLLRINSLPEVFTFLRDKYAERSSLHAQAQTTTLAAACLDIYRFFRGNLDPVLKLLLLQGAVLALALRARWLRLFRPAETNLLLLAALPVLLHYLFLFGFNCNHDYGTLKAEPAFCFLSAILFQQTFFRAGFSLRRTGPLLGAAALLCLVLGVRGYYRANTAWHPVTGFRDLGQAIGARAAPGDLAVLQTPYSQLMPQFSFYAKRSILWYTDDDTIRTHLHRHGLDRAVIFSIDARQQLTGTRELRPEP